MMDVSKKPPCNDKKMVVKMGTGGIGTVILYGGALATAAFASAFIVGLKKRRSHDEPTKKSDEQVHEFVSLDNKVSSVAVSKEIESDIGLLGDAQSLELDEKKDGNRVEQSGDGEMKGMDHVEAVEVIGENVEECCDQEESGWISVDKTLAELHNDEMVAEKNSERKTDVGENEEVKIEGVEETKLDFVANTNTDQVEGEEQLVTESPVMEHRNADSGVKDEVIQEDGVTEGIREDEVKHVVEEELLEKEQKEIHQSAAEQVNGELSNAEHEKSEEVDEEKSYNEKEMTSSKECEANEVVPENNVLETTGKEVDGSAKTNIDADLSAKTTDTETEKINEMEKGETEIIVGYDEMELSDEVEESSVGTRESSTDSNSEAVWPSEVSSETQQVNLINQEIAGKALEDKKPDAGSDFHGREINLNKESLRASAMDHSIYRNMVNKYLAEFQMVKDQPGNAMKKGMLIMILSVFSSYSCSWLFGCSFVKLSLIMFFSIVLSKIHGY